jgi:hypothetical protein
MVFPAHLVKMLPCRSQPLHSAAVLHQPFRHLLLTSFQLLDLTSRAVNPCHLPIKKVPLSVRVGRGESARTFVNHTGWAHLRFIRQAS